jgi:hypothetical protein
MGKASRLTAAGRPTWAFTRTEVSPAASQIPIGSGQQAEGVLPSWPAILLASSVEVLPFILLDRPIDFEFP